MKPKNIKTKSDVQSMSLDTFLDNMDADLEDGASEADEQEKPPKKKKAKLQDKSKPKKKQLVAEVPPTNGTAGKKSKDKRKKSKLKESDADEAEHIGGQKDVEREHQQALDKLQHTDPELYAFLKQNDKKLLKFGGMTQSDEDATDSENEDDDAVHELPDKLEVASDESDFEAEADGEEEKKDDEDDDDEEEETEQPGVQTKITLKLLKKWTNQLTLRPMKKVETIRAVCKAFNSVLVTVTGETNVIPAYKAEGSAIFNGVVQLCVLHLGNAVKDYLNLKDSKDYKNLKKNKRFTKVQACLRMYLVDLTNLLENVSSSHITNVLLKHLHQFCSFMVCFPIITKPILKRLIVIWSTSEEESIRVLSFLCILKITCGQMRRFLSDVLKNMYLAYVKNSKFVSPNTLPGINFMRRSLTEMFTLDMSVSYQHVFLYIRQLAIHLRNAVILQKKDSFQYIYNWQYVNSLKLWTNVLAVTYDKKELEPLIFPLVSIVTGVIKLIPSAQYFPLRFHCCRMLIDLSARTRVFVPVLPFLVEVLNSNSFNEEHKKLSMKPVDLTCLLRFAPANIQENGFKDAVLDQIYELSLEHLAHESASLCFPDLAVPIVTALRSYCKSTKVYKYSRKIKQLSDKIVENAAFIERERKLAPVKLNDLSAIESWEATRQANGTPLRTFYESFAQENEKNKRRQANQSEDINDYDLPEIKKPNKKQKAPREGPVELFPSDDEDENEVGIGSDEELSETPKKKAKKEKKVKTDGAPENGEKKKKKKKQKQLNSQEADVPLEKVDQGEAVDILKDLTLDDWE
ncbi:nucleolar complex protein 2 homolog [Toxorhynchites rutilus septentrionalis]|uniref:nucleolar complex protein 2 homolog n=1 Tax=Toxorhynchites rutilus septentrionalis TaxID=329112 RepID=UPI00247B2884|nr:nucleolar complex protein 2 homolog [Toxorhynchites rutilus septentrionalis]